MRRAWTHFPTAKSFKNSKCRPNRGGGRAKSVGDCSQCGRTLAKSHLQIDHVIPAGSIVSWETAGPFLKGLFTTSDNMRLVCKPCHHTITQMERFQCSAEEAVIRQKAIAFSKLKPATQTSILSSYDCNPILLKNAASRRAAYTAWLTHGSCDGATGGAEGQA